MISYNVAFEWGDASDDAAAAAACAAEVKQTPALDCDAIKKVSPPLPPLPLSLTCPPPPLLQAMSSFALPPSAVPPWAAAVPESVWVAAVKEAAQTGRDIKQVIKNMT